MRRREGYGRGVRTDTLSNEYKKQFPYFSHEIQIREIRLCYTVGFLTNLSRNGNAAVGLVAGELLSVTLIVLQVFSKRIA